MRSPNKFLTKDRYYNTARWVERDGAFLIFPSVWVQWNMETVLDVFVNRWTVGIGYYRFQLDWGRWRRRDPKGLIDWRASGLDGFISWSKKTFGHSWDRQDLENLFKQRPEWKHLVVMGDANSHYIRLLLARELASANDERSMTLREDHEGLSALEVVMEQRVDPVNEK